MDIRELVTQPGPIKGINPVEKQILIGMLKSSDDIHLVDLTRACIAEIGFRLCSNNEDNYPTFELQLTGMMEAVDLIKQSFDGAL